MATAEEQMDLATERAMRAQSGVELEVSDLGPAAFRHLKALLSEAGLRLSEDAESPTAMTVVDDEAA